MKSKTTAIILSLAMCVMTGCTSTANNANTRGSNSNNAYLVNNSNSSPMTTNAGRTDSSAANSASPVNGMNRSNSMVNANNQNRP